MNVSKSTFNLLIKVFFITYCTFAFSYLDMDSELKLELKEFSRAVESRRGEDLVKMANLLSGVGLTDEVLFEKVESRLKQDYDTHLSEPKNKQIAKDVNALMRAYASFGKPQSQHLIEMILANSKSRGVRNRAVRLIPKLSWFGERNKIMQNPGSYKAGQNIMTHRYLNLINSSDYTMRRWGSEELNRRGGAEASVYDAMADALKKEGKQIKSDLHLDVLAWYCKILAKYEPGTYADLLRSIRKGSSYHKKLKKYAKT